MTISVFEFGAVDALSNPIHPAGKITRGVALDVNHTCLKNTKLARVVSTTDVRICLGDTPTAADELLLANVAKDFRLPGNVVLTIMATTASLSATSASDVTIALAVGAANGMLITVTAVDAAGATVAAVHELELFMSTSSVGALLTATAYSGSLVASTGALLTTLTAKKHFTLVTDANGVFVGTLTDTAKPATEYVCVKKPGRASLKVSAVSGVTWG